MFDSLMSSVARRAAIPFYGYQYRSFLHLLQRSRDCQREWLLARIRRCRETRFGRDHGFASIRTTDDFRRQVPIARYDHFAPYIDAVARGEFDALFPSDERVLRFTITTGSTGVPKLNPVTESWLKEYRNAWNMWGVKTLLDHPAQVGGKILQMAGTWDMGRTPCGIPISMVSALVARYQNPVVRHFYAIPNEVPEIRDATARYYAMLRLAIVKQIGLIILMNPGTLLMLAELGNKHRESLIRDVHDGTLSAEFEIPADIRRMLAPCINHPAPQQAAWLARIVESTGTLYPGDYWANHGTPRSLAAGWEAPPATRPNTCTSTFPARHCATWAWFPAKDVTRFPSATTFRPECCSRVPISTSSFPWMKATEILSALWKGMTSSKAAITIF